MSAWTWVADASVVCKWHFEEEDTPLAKSLLLRGDKIFAPDSLLSEFGNAISRKIREDDLSPEASREMAELVGEQITHFVPARELLFPALEMSVELRHPIYDCLYLALALQEGAVLVTDDRAFLRKTADSRWRENVLSMSDFAQRREE